MLHIVYVTQGRKETVAPQATLTVTTTDPNHMKLSNFEELFIYETMVKPALQDRIPIVFVEGKSGTGKSSAMVLLQLYAEMVFRKVTGITYRYDVIQQNVFTPQEYYPKLKWWIEHPNLTFGVDELRFLLPKHKWQSLIVQSIGEVNETIRAVKSDSMEKLTGVRYAGIIFYNSQSLTDVSKDVRKTVDIDIILNREDIVRARIYEFWTERYNIERPIMRPRKIQIRIGHNLILTPSNASMFSRPPQCIFRKFMKASVEAKAAIFRKKREKIVKELEKEFGSVSLEDELQNEEIWNMVSRMAKYRKGRVVFSKEAKLILRKMFGLSEYDFRKKFVPAFVELAKKRGLIE